MMHDEIPHRSRELKVDLWELITERGIDVLGSLTDLLRHEGRCTRKQQNDYHFNRRLIVSVDCRRPNMAVTTIRCR